MLLEEKKETVRKIRHYWVRQNYSCSSSKTYDETENYNNSIIPWLLCAARDNARTWVRTRAPHEKEPRYYVVLYLTESFMNIFSMLKQTAAE